MSYFMRKMLLICTITLGLGILVQQKLTQKTKKGASLDRILLVSSSQSNIASTVIETPKKITLFKKSLAIQDSDFDLPDLGDTELKPRRRKRWGETGTDGLWRSQIEGANQMLIKVGFSPHLR